MFYHKPKSRLTIENTASVIGAFILYYCVGCQISFTIDTQIRFISGIITAYLCLVAELGTRLSSYLRRDYRWKMYKVVIFMIGVVPGSLIWALGILKNENWYFEIVDGVVCGVYWGVAYDLVYHQSLHAFFVDRPFLTLNVRDVSLVLGLVCPLPTILSTILMSVLPLLMLNISPIDNNQAINERQVLHQ